jgi:hypothetical protein
MIYYSGIKSIIKIGDMWHILGFLLCSLMERGYLKHLRKGKIILKEAFEK